MLAATGFASDGSSLLETEDSNNFPQLLQMEVGQFIMKLRSNPAELDRLNVRTKHRYDLSASNIDIEATVDEALTKLQEFRLHRLYVTSDRKLVGVVTLQDIIKDLF